jgi:hypothetical protein
MKTHERMKSYTVCSFIHLEESSSLWLVFSRNLFQTLARLPDLMRPSDVYLGLCPQARGPCLKVGHGCLLASSLIITDNLYYFMIYDKRGRTVAHETYAALLKQSDPRKEILVCLFFRNALKINTECWGEYLDHSEMKWQEVGEHYTMRSFITCIILFSKYN